MCWPLRWLRPAAEQPPSSLAVCVRGRPAARAAGWPSRQVSLKGEESVMTPEKCMSMMLKTMAKIAEADQAA